MILEKIALINFKNYRELNVDFGSKFNCFIGGNGEGKTNLLDAIYYLSFCKSFFTSIDSQVVFYDERMMMVQGEYCAEKNKKEIINCAIKKGYKKQFKRNKKEYNRLAEHIGLFPAVMISPADGQLITEGSDLRRKFIDGIISQCNRKYLDALLKYQKVLTQRNALLKRFSETRTFDALSLEIWDDQLIPLATKVYEKRKEFLLEFIPYFQKYYNLISAQKETVHLTYLSQLHEVDLGSLLKNNLVKDRAANYTNFGIHKDDLLFDLKDYSLKKFGSQGQQKSYLLALKLAQFQYIKKQKNTTPILLLDDIFDKLDSNRIANFLKIINADNFGQVFITDTNFERTYKILGKLDANHNYFIIKQGEIEKKK